MDRRIGGLVRNPFSLECFDEALGRHAGELGPIVMKDVRVLAIASDARIEGLRRDAGNFAEQAIEQPGIGVAAARLLVEARQLRAKIAPCHSLSR